MSKDEHLVIGEKTEFLIAGRRQQLKKRILTEYLLALRTFKFLAVEALVKHFGVSLENSEGGFGESPKTKIP